MLAPLKGLVSLSAALPMLWLAPAPTPAAKTSRPNIILILADDLGFGDLRCYGSERNRTPHIDNLAQSGMKFTQSYAACAVCTPTRAALLTGKSPARLHITDWLPGSSPENPKLLVPAWTKHLPLEEATLANAFKAAGYATASIGKWHLGGPAFYPEKHGFDLNVAGTEAGYPKSYFAPWGIATLSEGKRGDYLTDRLASEALEFIERHRDAPFFLYLPHFAVHAPIQGPRDLVRKYRAQSHLGGIEAAYAAMLERLDDAVGRVRQKLGELGLAERTVIVFTSDNGADIPAGSNRPLRAGKGASYEGGIRVPLLVYWPGTTKAGTVSDTPVISMDLYPTLLEMGGIADTAGHRSDGTSLVPLLAQSGGLTRDALFWHLPHYETDLRGGAAPHGAVRQGDFKLLEFYDDMRVELYNLRDDVGEQHDLAEQMPEKAQELRQELHRWRESVGAQMPAPNPGYDAKRPEISLRSPKANPKPASQAKPPRTPKPRKPPKTPPPKTN